MIDEPALNEKVEKIPLDFLWAVLRALETIYKYYYLRHETHNLSPRKAERLLEDLKGGIPIEFMDITVDVAYEVEGFLNTIPLQKVSIQDFHRGYTHVKFDPHNHVFNFYMLPFHSEIKDFLAAYLKNKSEKWWDEGTLPQFNEGLCRITLGNRYSQIPLDAISKIVVCKTVFEEPLGKWVTDGQMKITRDFAERSGSRWVSDAVRALNKLLLKDFGITKFFEYHGRSLRVRIRAEIFK